MAGGYAQIYDYYAPIYDMYNISSFNGLLTISWVVLVFAYSQPRIYIYYQKIYKKCTKWPEAMPKLWLFCTCIICRISPSMYCWQFLGIVLDFAYSQPRIDILSKIL